MYHVFTRLQMGVKNILYRQVESANANTTQLRGNNWKQLELAKVINIILVVFV